MVKNLPAVWETQVRSLGWEDPLEKGMAAHSSMLAWKIPWTDEPGRLQSTGSQRIGHDWATNSFVFSFLLGRKAMTNLDSILKSRDITLSTKVHIVKTIFSISDVWMYIHTELYHVEGWVLKNCCFQTVVLEKSWESLGLQGDQTSQS